MVGLAGHQMGSQELQGALPNLSVICYLTSPTFWALALLKIKMGMKTSRQNLLLPSLGPAWIKRSKGWVTIRLHKHSWGSHPAQSIAQCPAPAASSPLMCTSMSSPPRYENWGMSSKGALAAELLCFCPLTLAPVMLFENQALSRSSSCSGNLHIGASPWKPNAVSFPLCSSEFPSRYYIFS